MAPTSEVDALLARFAADRAALAADTGRRNAARRMAVGRLFAGGALELVRLESFPPPEHPEDRAILDPRWLRADGWVRDPAGSWLGPEHFPEECPIRPSETHARDVDGTRARTGQVSGGGTGGGAPAASAEQLDEDERARVAWERFYEQARNRLEWQRRQARRAWLVGAKAVHWAAGNLDVVRPRLPPGDLPLFEPALLEHDGWPPDGPEEG